MRAIKAPSLENSPQDYLSDAAPSLIGLNISPEHHHLAVAGGAFSTQVKSAVFRGEAAYYNGKHFQTTDPRAMDALIEKDYLHYLFGIDYSIKGLNLSAQFIQEAIMDYDDLLKTNEDALIRPKITYDFDDSFSILLESNIFIGNESGRFGQYHDNSMIYAKIRYNF